ncbi:Sister chromatid cohesion protein DCC1 [Frankliniella fusca]|uniref:Sister chromatid cohesion protein DCC1 n=1 Tax=Frankliniella fusca TaxID=407009 RepID=A0AAE1H5R6_9NEOP|nr:Sister chromatid cohesion protein DCC1 [Frankliniella fusca]
MASRYNRTNEEVLSVLSNAKVLEKDLSPVTQVLSFSEPNNLEENLLLLELDNSLLELLNNGDCLAFRGDKNESAVMCTKSKTFDVKTAEISNSLALVPEILWSQDTMCSSADRILKEKNVVKVFNEYLEVRHCGPRLQKLRSLLAVGEYSGPEYEKDLKESGVKLLTLHDLLHKIQASEEELLAALKENFACCIDGYWRCLEFNYHFRVLSSVLQVVDENSWPLNGLVCKEVLESLEELVPEVILNHLMEWYTFENPGENTCTLREDRICKVLGEVLLRPAGKWNLQEFLTAWQQSVPEGMVTNMKYLEGVAIKDTSCQPQVVRYFPEWDLPEDIGERFKVLFKAREKWTVDEIRPYIERLTTSKMNVNALLTKHARASTSNGMKYYSARHGK